MDLSFFHEAILSSLTMNLLAYIESGVS